MGRIIAIIVAAIVAVAAAAYFIVGSTARGGGEFTVERKPETVLAWLASAPAGAPVAEGVTVTEIVSHEGNVVVANVAYADGATGRVTYTVTPSEADANQTDVDVRLERNLGLNPLNRVQAVTGGDAPALATAAAEGARASLSALTADITPIAFTIETLTPQPFFYVDGCTRSEDESIVRIMRQAQTVIPQLIRANNLQVAGNLYALEPRVDPNGRYCYEVGYPFSGTPPAEGDVLAAEIGQTPGGAVLRVDYTGTEADVESLVYDRLDALLAAARFDATPADKTDDWPTFEVYHDDPTQAGGSRNRSIYYVVPEGVNVEVLAAQAAQRPSTAPADGTTTTEGAATTEGATTTQP